MGPITPVDPQKTLADVSLATNPEPRCACILLLDTSGSMAGAKIAELNAGLVAYRDQMTKDPLAAKRVEAAVVTFGGKPKIVADFVTLNAFQPPTLAAEGQTPMGEAIIQAGRMILQRKEVYRKSGIGYFRPWIFLVTDGQPTDDWKSAAEMVKHGEDDASFVFFAAGVEGADFNTLKQISVRAPIALKGLEYVKLFEWLSNSQKQVSANKTGQTVQIQPPSPDFTIQGNKSAA